MDIEFLLWLQGIRQSAPALVQAMFSFMGSEVAMVVAMVLPCIVYWCLDRACGQFALLAYGASSMSNQLIKNIVCEYRPWVRNPRVTPDRVALEGAGGYSFPSGHTQSSSSMLMGLSWHHRHERRWPLVLGLLFAAMVGFSRLFLGVHAPQDVLVGFAEGCAFVLLAERLVPWLEEREGRDAWALLVGSLLTLAYLVFVTVKTYPTVYVDGALLVDPAEMIDGCYKAGGVFVGVLAGWFVERRYVRFETGGLSLLEGTLRVLVGGLVVFLAYKPLGALMIALFGEWVGEFGKHAVAFFAATAGAPSLFAPLGKRLAEARRR